MSIFDTIPGHDTIDQRREPHPMTDPWTRQPLMTRVGDDMRTAHQAVTRMRQVTELIAGDPALAALVDAAIDAHRAGVTADVLDAAAAGLRSAASKRTGPNPVLSGPQPAVPEVAPEVAAFVAAKSGDLPDAADLTSLRTMTAKPPRVPGNNDADTTETQVIP